MERRNFLKAAAITGVAGISLSACAETQKGQGEPLGSGGYILHSVYFWLKPGLTEDEERDFLNFFEALRKVPGIRSLTFGKPAPTNPRPVVDNSFSYHLVITFNSMDDINVYEKHPQHTSAAEKYSKYWDRVEVRDTVFD